MVALVVVVARDLLMLLLPKTLSQYRVILNHTSSERSQPETLISLCRNSKNFRQAKKAAPPLVIDLKARAFHGGVGWAPVGPGQL